MKTALAITAVLFACAPTQALRRGCARTEHFAADFAVATVAMAASVFTWNADRGAIAAGFMVGSMTVAIAASEVRTCPGR